MSGIASPPLPLESVLNLLSSAYPYHPIKDVAERDPFKVLVCKVLSRENATPAVMLLCVRLFMAADSPEAILALSSDRLTAFLSPLGNAAEKESILRAICQVLVDDYNGQTPKTVSLLASLPYMDWATAQRVAAISFNHPALCVDDSAHRIMNRLGYVQTTSPEETAAEIQQFLPQRYWSLLSWVLDRHGNESCRERKPQCDICPVTAFCRKINIDHTLAA